MAKAVQKSFFGASIADLTRKNEDRFCKAVEHQNVEKCREILPLLPADTKVGSKSDEYGWTLLHWAVFNLDQEMTGLVLKLPGVDVNRLTTRDKKITIFDYFKKQKSYKGENPCKALKWKFSKIRIDMAKSSFAILCDLGSTFDKQLGPCHIVEPLNNVISMFKLMLKGPPVYQSYDIIYAWRILEDLSWSESTPLILNSEVYLPMLDHTDDIATTFKYIFIYELLPLYWSDVGILKVFKSFLDYGADSTCRVSKTLFQGGPLNTYFDNESSATLPILYFMLEQVWKFNQADCRSQWSNSIYRIFPAMACLLMSAGAVMRKDDTRQLTRKIYHDEMTEPENRDDSGLSCPMITTLLTALEFCPTEYSPRYIFSDPQNDRLIRTQMDPVPQLSLVHASSAVIRHRLHPNAWVGVQKLQIPKIVKQQITLNHEELCRFLLV